MRKVVAGPFDLVVLGVGAIEGYYQPAGTRIDELEAKLSRY
jgi:hypothetical protein